MASDTTSRPPLLERLLALESRHADLDLVELRRRIVAGEPDAWRQFVERYSRALYTMARALAGPRDREEIAHEVYLAVLERLSNDEFRLLREFRGESRFETYLFTAVRNEVAHLRRRRAKEREVTSEHEPAAPVDRAPPRPSVADAIGLDPQRVAGVLAESMSRLAPADRLLLRLRFADGLPYRRLARLFDWKDTNAAAYEVRRVLRKLDLLGRCRERLRWGEPERDVLLRGLRAVLERDDDDDL